MDAYIEEEKPFYIRVWRRVLVGFLGWPDPMFEVFVAKWNERLNDPSHGFYHEAPLRYVTRLLIPYQLQSTLNVRQADRFQEQIEKAIDGGDCFSYTGDDFDWEAARQRVERLLAEYGERLPVYHPAESKNSSNENS